MIKLRIPLLVVTIILSAFLLRGKISHEKFSSNVWKTANLNLEENMSLLWDMMNDLRNKHRLIGFTRNEILLLLGKPETNTNSEFIYYLGYSKTGINTGNLTLIFLNDKVTEIRVWQG